MGNPRIEINGLFPSSSVHYFRYVSGIRLVGNIRSRDLVLFFFPIMSDSKISSFHFLDIVGLYNLPVAHHGYRIANGVQFGQPVRKRNRMIFPSDLYSSSILFTTATSSRYSAEVTSSISKISKSWKMAFSEFDHILLIDRQGADRGINLVFQSQPRKDFQAFFPDRFPVGKRARMFLGCLQSVMFLPHRKIWQKY